MKGVIFNVLEEFITENFGEDTLDEILDLCPVHSGPPWVGPGTYPDTDLIALAGQAAETLGLPLDDALVAFGQFLFGRLAARYPVFLQGHTDTKTFLMTIHDVIHVEVRKLYPEAVTPTFTFEDPGAGELLMHYASARNLPGVAHGLILGAADHFGEETDVVRSPGDGEGHWTFHVELRPATVASP